MTADMRPVKDARLWQGREQLPPGGGDCVSEGEIAMRGQAGAGIWAGWGRAGLICGVELRFTLNDYHEDDGQYCAHQ